MKVCLARHRHRWRDARADVHVTPRTKRKEGKESLFKIAKDAYSLDLCAACDADEHLQWSKSEMSEAGLEKPCQE